MFFLPVFSVVHPSANLPPTHPPTQTRIGPCCYGTFLLNEVYTLLFPLMKKKNPDHSDEWIFLLLSLPRDQITFLRCQPPACQSGWLCVRLSMATSCGSCVGRYALGVLEQDPWLSACQSARPACVGRADMKNVQVTSRSGTPRKQAVGERQYGCHQQAERVGNCR